MREACLVGASHRRGGPITTLRDREVRPAPDLAARNFASAPPNQFWVADITDVPTAVGASRERLCIGRPAPSVRGGKQASALRSRTDVQAVANRSIVSAPDEAGLNPGKRQAALTSLRK